MLYKLLCIVFLFGLSFVVSTNTNVCYYSVCIMNQSLSNEVSESKKSIRKGGDYHIVALCIDVSIMNLESVLHMNLRQIEGVRALSEVNDSDKDDEKQEESL